MNTNYKETIWDKLREVLSHVNIKTYIYGILVLGVLIMILINVKDANKYGHLNKNGKFVLDIENVARDYGLDIENKENKTNIDYVNNNENNFTEDLSRSLFLTNLYLEQNGMTDPNARGQVLAGIISNYKEQIRGQIYTDKDIKIALEDTKENVSKYYYNIKTVLTEYSIKVKESEKIRNELENTANIESVNNLKLLLERYINNTINSNEVLINDLLKIEATKSGATYQLQLINLFAKENIFLKSLIQIETDPAKYLILGGESYTTTFENDFLSIDGAFSRYFKSFGINN